MNTKMTPTLLRGILGVMLFIVLGLGIGVAVIANNRLSKVAEETSQSLAVAKASDGNLQSLQTIEQKLLEQQSSVKRAQDIVGLSEAYTYQNQVILDLNSYADESGVKIQNIDFSSGNTPASGAAPSTPASPDSATAVPSAGSAPTVSAVKASSVTITLESGTKYEKLLTFFNRIEQSLPKLQISSVGLTKSGKGDGVDSQALQIDVYIR